MSSIRGIVIMIAVAALAAAAIPNHGRGSTPVTYPRCAELNKAYPHGVGRKGAKDTPAPGETAVTNFHVDDAAYDRNSALDVDKNGIACEKH